MKLLIELPTWLGDAVMASGAVEKLITYTNPKKVIFFGSFVSTSLYKENYEVIVDDRKHRFKQLFKLPKADMFVSFRNSLYSKILAFKYNGYTFKNTTNLHMVEKYNLYVNSIIKKDLPLFPPKLNFKSKKFNNKTFGINPGATYGSAKRWYPEEFAKVANYLGNFGDVIIFGGPGEEEIAKDIEKNLAVKNYQNLCGKLSIKELCEYIGGLSGFITNDSGPMHIAAAYGVPTVAIFGPTNYKETSQWMNKKGIIVSKNLNCSPCMKRSCPLKHHNCMKTITADDVITEIKHYQLLEL